MPDTYPDSIPVKGAQMVRLSIASLTAGTKVIASYGTAMNFPIVGSEHPKFANVHEDLTYISKKLSGGDTLKHVENSNAYLAASGDAAPKSDNSDSIKFSIAMHYTDFKALKAVWKDTDKRIACAVGYGRIASAETVPGYLFIIGKPLGDLEWDSTEDIQTIDIEIKGGEVYTAGAAGAVSHFNTAMSGNFTLLNAATLPVPSLSAATASVEYSDLLGGKITVKDAA